MKDPSLIFIVGPTAAGKSEISLRVSSLLNKSAEIVCCDAMQVYREITVASDKPSAEARACAMHHLVDIVSVTEDFNVALYRQLAVSTIQDVQARSKTPLVVGGSGMYMSVLLDGIFDGAAAKKNIREELVKELAEKDISLLHHRLKTLDPQASAKIHPNDSQRIIRALQVIMSTGEPISQLQQKREGLWGKMPIKIFGLNRPREELYQRAEARVENMFANGLVEEIRRVSALPLSQSARKVIGIPEVSGYLNGEYGLEQAKYLMKLNTRHYVKRQLTWFRRDKRLTWIDITPDQSAQQVAEIIASACR